MMPDALYNAITGAVVRRENAVEFVRALDAAGYVIVPKEPTDAMIVAGQDAMDRAESEWQSNATYLAMIHAFQ